MFTASHVCFFVMNKCASLALTCELLLGVIINIIIQRSFKQTRLNLTFPATVFSCVLEERPLVADIRGLEYMNDDPNAVDVLYAKVSLQDGSSRCPC